MIRPSRKSCMAFWMIGVINRFKGPRVGGNGSAHFPQLHGGHAMILIHHADAQVMDFPAKRVSQDDQLHDAA